MSQIRIQKVSSKCPVVAEIPAQNWIRVTLDSSRTAGMNAVSSRRYRSCISTCWRAVDHEIRIWSQNTRQTLQGEGTASRPICLQAPPSIRGRMSSILTYRPRGRSIELAAQYKTFHISQMQQIQERNSTK